MVDVPFPRERLRDVAREEFSIELPQTPFVFETTGAQFTGGT